MIIMRDDDDMMFSDMVMSPWQKIVRKSGIDTQFFHS